jgi:hypothetical protein
MRYENQPRFISATSRKVGVYSVSVGARNIPVRCATGADDRK